MASAADGQAHPGADPAFRRRLLSGLAGALRDGDYHHVTIADIVQRAGTSKRTFYEQFAGKRECLLALLRETNAEIVRRIAAEVDPDAPWRTQARQAVEAMVAVVQSDPAVFLTWIRAAPSLGPAGRDLARDAMDAFVALTRALADTPQLKDVGITPPSRELAVILFGGLRELIATTLEEGGDVAALTDVATEAVTLVLGPRPR